MGPSDEEQQPLPPRPGGTSDGRARSEPPIDPRALPVVLARSRPEDRGTLAVADVAIGLGSSAIGFARSLVRVGKPLLQPVTGAVLRPALLAEQVWPQTLLRRVAARGRRERVALVKAAARAVLALVPDVVAAVLDQIDLTSQASQRVDLNAVARGLDVDAVVERVNLDRIVERVLDHLDVDAIVAQADLGLIVDRLPIDRVLDRVDLDALAARIDVNAVVDRVDLVGIAQYIIEEVDLPEIIRSSTGSIVSDTVRGVRMQSITADEQLSRVVDRVLMRRRPRRTGAPVERKLREPAGEPMPTDPAQADPAQADPGSP